jgi:hypothetical protein
MTRSQGERAEVRGRRVGMSRDPFPELKGVIIVILELLRILHPGHEVTEFTRM